MNKEEIVTDVSKSLTRPIGILQALFLLCFLGSPFVWIWTDFNIFWKVCLTGFIGTIIMYFLYKIIVKAATEVVDDEIKKQLYKKGEVSKFSQKLNKAMKG